MAARGDTEISAAGGHALVDEIAAKIRERIMSGDIPIGAQLRQAELASDFGVSRTPVREALRLFADDKQYPIFPFYTAKASGGESGYPRDGN